MQRRTLILAVLPLLAACASTAPVREPQTALPGAFDAQALAGAAPLDRWWAAYNDPQLSALVEEALASSPDGRIAQARLVEARAQRLANIRSAYPQGALSANASTRGNSTISGTQSPFSSSGTAENYSLDFDVSWEVDLWGRTRTARRAVENDFASKVFNIEGSRAALAAGVADSLFAARGLAQQLDDARGAAAISRALLDTAQTRAQRGLGATSDARRVAADVAQSDANVVQLEAELNAARRTLLVLVGRGGASRDTLPVTLALGVPPSPPATVPGELLQRRPDVREAEERLAVAIAQLKVSRLDLFPKFTLMPGVGLMRSDQTFGSQSFSSTLFNWSIGAGVSVPILRRPELIAITNVRAAQAEQAVLAYEKAVQTAYGEADNALLQLTADKNRLTLLEAGERAARESYDANRRLYDAGLTDLTTLLQTEQAWRGARAQATSARTQALRRSVQAFKALGGGWDAANPPSATPST